MPLLFFLFSTQHTEERVYTTSVYEYKNIVCVILVFLNVNDNNKNVYIYFKIIEKFFFSCINRQYECVSAIQACVLDTVHTKKYNVK